ncbi:MAG: 23S rRNA (adenine(2503)-C(2))-methyltransferase RlmN [Firmicutes bacterium]|nr:23S rRNA (adenine(2503)-C(2))-methyltransferase RlmN [Bacillota bacterium]
MNILDLELKELEKIIKEAGQPGFRAKQIFGWVAKGDTETESMRNVPKSFWESLPELRAELPETEQTQRSKDGTVKCLLRMKDGKAVEAVFMKYKYGNSVCISSQAGCRMGCAFCASGMNGLERDLTAGEMYGEILAMEKATGEKISHLVVMGTGEPFDNYENLSKFIRIMNDPSGKNLGMRNITVSTCGLIPVIDRFGDDFPQVNLAISLHAADSEERSEIMPVNRAYPLADLIEACRRYTEKTGRRITFEYTLIHGVNDDRQHLDKLVSLLHGMLCHVNLIPLNAVKEKGFVPGTRERAEEFRDALEKRGIPATVRRELGSDIDAACGQLRLKN